MARKISALATAFVAVLGTSTLLTATAVATNVVIGGSMSPLMAKSFKEANGWSSGDYFGPRSGAFTPAVNLAANFRERNGYFSGDYFGPKG
jgi:hypothetical protein